MVEEAVHDKVMSLDEAIKKNVDDGCHISLGCLPRSFAGIYEIIRQKKRDLNLVGLGFLEESDLLVGAGCIESLQASFFGSLEIFGLSKTLRRAVEKHIPHKIRLEEYSNFSSLMRFVAGALDLPFMPTRSLLGSDIVNKKGFLGDMKLKTIDCPFTGDKLVAVPALKPDVCIIHAQRADAQGNIQMWGILFGGPWEAYASKRIVATVEEVVEGDVVRKDPAITNIPGFMVDAIVEAPYGAHPWSVTGYYDIDLEYRKMYAEMEREEDTFNKYLEEWVFRCETHQQYLNKLGLERLMKLKATQNFSYPINYGHYRGGNVFG